MSAPDSRPAVRNEAWRLGLLFGTLYFLQGFGEPTEGLIAQPVRSLLGRWGSTSAEITGFMAVLGIPWALKPLYGLLTDFVPLWGTRRKGYLILAATVTALSLLGLFALPVQPGGSSALLVWLLVPTVAVAAADVTTDALMIERAQPLGLTGTLQAVQWGCAYAAGLFVGPIGGRLSHFRRETVAFLICGLSGVLTVALVVFGVREPARTPSTRTVRTSMAALRAALTPGSNSVLAVGAFLFLWNFNPFSNHVLHLHITRALGLDELFYGTTVALTAFASIAASVAYGLYCRRVPMRLLVHTSIILGIVSTLGYAVVADRATAVAVTLATGVTYMTATLIQFDLAARACPPAAAGTVFAVLMSLENLSAVASTWLGGKLYEFGLTRWGNRVAFQVLVLIGSALTACCWLLVPALPAVSTSEPPQRDVSGG
jgi:hypothetical protein